MTQLKDRQQGTTTFQIKNAPEGAFYIWPEVRTLHYPRELAAHLGRLDLRIRSLSTLRPERVQGLREAFVLDHACTFRLDAAHCRALEILRSRPGGDA